MIILLYGRVGNNPAFIMAVNALIFFFQDYDENGIIELEDDRRWFYDQNATAGNTGSGYALQRRL